MGPSLAATLWGAEKLRRAVHNIDLMQIVVEKGGRQAVFLARGERDVMIAMRAQRLGHQIDLSVEGNNILTLNEVT